MSEMVPAQMVLDVPWLSCRREDCHWARNVQGDPLTEVVALAREHVEEAHRG